MTLAATSLVINDKVAAPSMVALAADNTYEDIPIARGAGSKVILKVTVATAATTTTIKAGVSPPAIAAGQGDLAFTSLATGTYYIILETGRFAQANGNIQIKAATAANVTAAVLKLPRGF